MQVKCCPAHVLAARIGISRSIVATIVDQLGAIWLHAYGAIWLHAWKLEQNLSGQGHT